MTLIKNIRFSADDEKSDGYVFFDKGIITKVGHGECEGAPLVMDGLSNVLYPGLCDVHTHGARGVDFTTSDVDEICKLASWYASCGVTSVFATTTTHTKEQIIQAVKNIAQASKKIDGLNIDGIHLEGPFLSSAKRGAHNENLLCLPDIDFVKQVLKLCGKLKLRITVAPEISGALEFISQCKKLGVFVTLGHSSPSTECALKAVECGADCVTHTFNAMNQLHHREPGLLGVGLAEDIFAEIISDGLHVHPTAVKMLYNAKGISKTLLVSDSIVLAGCNEADGVMESAGQKVYVKDGQILTVEGDVLAGSSLKLCDGVKNFKDFCGIALDEAVLCASETAARAVGNFHLYGSVEIGKRADFVLMDKNGNLVHTICGGKIVF